MTDDVVRALQLRWITAVITEPGRQSCKQKNPHASPASRASHCYLAFADELEPKVNDKTGFGGDFRFFDSSNIRHNPFDDFENRTCVVRAKFVADSV